MTCYQHTREPKHSNSHIARWPRTSFCKISYRKDGNVNWRPPRQSLRPTPLTLRTTRLLQLHSPLAYLSFCPLPPASPSSQTKLILFPEAPHVPFPLCVLCVLFSILYWVFCGPDHFSHGITVHCVLSAHLFTAVRISTWHTRLYMCKLPNLSQVNATELLKLVYSWSRRAFTEWIASGWQAQPGSMHAHPEQRVIEGKWPAKLMSKVLP